MHAYPSPLLCWHPTSWPHLQKTQKYDPHHDYFSFEGADDNGGNRWVMTGLQPAIACGMPCSCPSRCLRPHATSFFSRFPAIRHVFSPPLNHAVYGTSLRPHLSAATAAAWPPFSCTWQRRRRAARRCSPRCELGRRLWGLLTAVEVGGMRRDPHGGGSGNKRWCWAARMGGTEGARVHRVPRASVHTAAEGRAGSSRPI
jgi:hypothetical protein